MSQRQARRNLNRRNGISPHRTTGGGGALLSRQSLLLLSAGILVGYILLPVILVEMDIENVMLTLPKANSVMKQTAPLLRPTRQDSFPPRTLDSKPQTTVDVGQVEKRLVEDRHVLARQSLPTATTPYVMKTATLPDHHRLKILVTGGAGFVGSHLVDKLMMEGQEVIVVDNFFTGQKKNIAHWLHHPNFK